MQKPIRLIVAFTLFASIVGLTYFSNGEPTSASVTPEDTDTPLAPLRSVLSALNTQDHATSRIDVVVEVPQGSHTKYTYDQQSGTVQYDRPIPPAVRFPGEYGIVPGTLSGDNNPLEVIVMGQGPTFPGVHIPARPIGLIRIRIATGVQDDKVIALPALDPGFDKVIDLTNLSPDMREEIAGFFRSYVDFDGTRVGVIGWGDVEQAQLTVLQAKAAHARAYPYE